MASALLRYAAPLGGLAMASAQFFPPTSQPQNMPSKFNEAITVSSIETNTLCETTPNVKSYSGYVSMSGAIPEIGGLPGYPLNTFYWFFEARNNPETAPFVLWHSSGPGFPSSASAIYENGPCLVGEDSNSTTLNPFSWNNVANILYLDSPSMVGFSYDVLTNATINGLDPDLTIVPANFTSGNVPEANNTFQVGTFGSQNLQNTANSTGNTSPLTWATLQAWFSEFPQYQPANGKLNLWSESYGGRFIPLLATYVEQQNELIQNGTQSGLQLGIDTIGLINAYIDPAKHVASYPAFVNNNTYGLQTVTPEVQASMQQNLTKPGGCADIMSQCQSIAPQDASDNALNTTIDKICSEAFVTCLETVQNGYVATSGRALDDITESTLEPFPTQNYVGFFSQHWVQEALGARINYTSNSAAVLNNFVASGDLGRAGAVEALAGLLNRGTLVALINGDRDYQLNWIGGEQASLALGEAAEMPSFAAAGYANFSYPDAAATSNNASSYPVGGSTWGGVTRQAGNFSFTRIFQAGHSVPAYKPAAALTFFTRALAHRDIATGNVNLNAASSASYVTSGPASSFSIKNVVPPMPPPICYTWEITHTCPMDLQQALADGTAIVQDFVATLPGNASTGTSSGTSGASGVQSSGSSGASGAPGAQSSSATSVRALPADASASMGVGSAQSPAATIAASSGAAFAWAKPSGGALLAAVAGSLALLGGLL